MKNLSIARDSKGIIAYGRNFSDSGLNASVTTGDTSSVTVPAGASLAFIILSSGAALFSQTKVSTSIPSPGSSFSDSIAQCCNGADLFTVTEGNFLNFRALNDAVITISFYAGQGG